MIYVAYDWPNECASLGNWLLHTWDFWNSRGHREWGVRLFGVVVSNWCDDD